MGFDESYLTEHKVDIQMGDKWCEVSGKVVPRAMKLTNDQ